MNDTNTTKPKVGMVKATPGAVAAIEEASENAVRFVVKHACRELGEVPPDDWEDYENKDEPQVLCVYTLRTGTKIMAITEPDGGVTTILLPSEY